MATPLGPNFAQGIVSGAGSLVLPVLPQPVIAGALIVVCGAMWRGSDPGPITVADTRGTSYTVRPTGTIGWSGGLSRGFMAYGRTVTPGTLVATITPAGGGSYISGGVVEGANGASSPEDGANEATGTGTAPAVGVTTSGADRALLGLFHSASPGSPTGITAAADVVLLGKDESNNQSPWALVWRRAPTAGLYALGFTLAQSREWRVVGFGLKP